MKRGPGDGRVAFREEGDLWNAYWAPMDTMEGAVFICSIRMGVVKRYPRIKHAFMSMATAVMAAFFEDEGIEAEWPGPEDAQPAPEHERAGHS